MVSEVKFEAKDSVAIIRLCRPVNNALTASVRRELWDVLDQVTEDDTYVAIVLAGVGDGFSGGLDLSEYDAGFLPPTMADITKRIFKSPKPVVAALHGFAMGAGFELALSATARVVSPSTRIALAEVHLGMSPCAGATQFLPRLIGAHRSLNVLLSGAGRSADDDVFIGVFAELTEGDVVKTACQLALSISADPQWRQSWYASPGFSEPRGYQNTIHQVETRIPEGDIARKAILKGVEAALLLPFDQGLALEVSIFDDLRVQESARAKRHLYRAERLAAGAAQVGSAADTDYETVAIFGHSEASVLACCFCLRQGSKVVVMCDSQDHHNFSMALHDALNASLSKEQRSETTIRALLDNCVMTQDPAGLSGVQMVVDTGHADLPDGIYPFAADCLWVGVNTQDATKGRAARLGLKDNVLTFRMPPAAKRFPLVEYSVVANSDRREIGRFVRYWGGGNSASLACATIAGHISGQMSVTLWCASIALLGAGVAINEIDAAAEAIGCIAPLWEIDQIGLERAAREIETLPLRPHWAALLRSYMSNGAGGRKQKLGFYDYSKDKVVPNAALSGSAVSASGASLDRLRLEPKDIQRALLAALVNRAEALIDARAVQHISDIDVAMVHGAGMRPVFGGPLFQADTLGLAPLINAMKNLKDIAPDIWTAQDRLLERHRYGRHFT